MKLLVIAGLPATGKSTLAKKLSAALNFPILEKDEIKEKMFDTIGFADRRQKRALDDAANAILLHCAEPFLQSGGSLIMVNNFDSDNAKALQALLDRYDCRCVTVFLGGDPDVLWRRYVERDKRRTRHQGHTFIDRYPPLEGDDVNATMPREYFAERFEHLGMGEISIRAPRIDVDATYPERTDVDALIAQVRALFESEE